MSFSRLPLRSHVLRPESSLTVPRTALSMGSEELVSLLLAIQATGSWLLPRRVCLLLNMSAFTGRTKSLNQYTSPSSEAGEVLSSRLIWGTSRALATDLHGKTLVPVAA